MSELQSEKSRTSLCKDDKEKVNGQNFFSFVILFQVQTGYVCSRGFKSSFTLFKVLIAVFSHCLFS